jgi:hypothetical protein
MSATLTGSVIMPEPDCFDLVATQSDVRFLGVKRTSLFHSLMSAFDPKRTSADAVGLSANCRQLGLRDQLVCARDEVRKRLRIRRVCPTSYCPLLAVPHNANACI